MPRYEYKVVPAPKKGQRARGVKGSEARFAHALETVMNQWGAEGWEYVRTDTLPCEERSGLTSKTTVFQNMLVFRREAQQDAQAEPPRALAAPEPEDDAAAEAEAEADTPAPAQAETPADAPADSPADDPDKPAIAAQ